MTNSTNGNFFHLILMLKFLLKKNIRVYAAVISMLMTLSFCKYAATGTEKRDETSRPSVTYSNPYFKGTMEERFSQVEKISKLFGVECDHCHNEELTVFAENGEISKKMMAASVALGVDCDYCHIDGKRYTEKENQARNMFELSETMAVECNFCHMGKEKLTSRGLQAKTAFLTRDWATKGSKQCLECHIEKKQFALNFYGWQVLNAMKGLKGM